MMNQATVAIPTYLRPEVLNHTLASLLPLTNVVSEVMLGVTGVSNQSVNRETMVLLKALDADGVFIRFASRFSGVMSAKQWFMEEATNDIVLILDDDAIPGAGYFDLLAHFDSPDVAAVSGALITPVNDRGYVEWDDSEIVDHSDEANTISHDPSTGLLDLGRKIQVYKHLYPKVYPCQYLIGTALFVRRSEVTIDLTYESNPAGEELDFTYAMYRSGKTLLFDASRVAWHLAAMSGGMKAVAGHNPSDLSYFATKWGFIPYKGLKTETYT